MATVKYWCQVGDPDRPIAKQPEQDETSMMKKLAGLLLLWPVLAISSVAVASDQQSAAELRKLLDQTTTLKGEFVQTLFDGQGKVQEESSGDFVLKRPGKFYWN